jgi:hypothetical protein
VVEDYVICYDVSLQKTADSIRTAGLGVQDAATKHLQLHPTTAAFLGVSPNTTSSLLLALQMHDNFR